jgi:probable lipoprotein NlpC
MIDTNKLIGIRWKFNGRDFNGVDCLGLLYLFFKENNWPETFDDGKPIEEGWFHTEPYRMYRYFLKHFDKYEDKSQLQYGDILLMNIQGESHVGIYINYDKFISTFPSKDNGLKLKTFSFQDRLQHWQSSFICFFRRRGD